MKKGIKIGIEQGIEQGTLATLGGLVQDNLLSVDEAARRANMTVEEFCAVLCELHIISK